MNTLFLQWIYRNCHHLYQGLYKSRIQSGNPDLAMPLMNHLDEFRSRALRSMFIFVIATLICFYFCEPILAFLRAPLFAALPSANQHLYFTSLFENFLTQLKVSAYSAFVLWTPYLCYEIWQFVAPGLYPHEKHKVIPFVLAAFFCFTGGSAFAYYVLFPIGFKYFITAVGPYDIPLLTIDAYYSTCLRLLFLFGLSFELPVFLVLLGLMGLISSKTLATQRKPAIIGITVLSAFVAPPDALSMILLALPLTLLFEGAIIVLRSIEPKVATLPQSSSQEPTPSSMPPKDPRHFLH